MCGLKGPSALLVMVVHDIFLISAVGEREREEIIGAVNAWI